MANTVELAGSESANGSRRAEFELTGGLVDVAAADASLEATEPPTMHERNGRPDQDADENELLLLVWDNFFAAVAKVWELSRPKRLTKDLMLNFVRHLR